MRQQITPSLLHEPVSKGFYEERFKRGYMMDYWPADKKKRLHEVIGSLELSEDGEALDFGCGDGTLTDVLRQALPRGWTVCGTDISLAAIEIARKHHPECTFFSTDDPRFVGRKYDFTFTHHVLEHVYDLSTVAEDLAARLRPASTMLHILPCGNTGSLEYRICAVRKDGIESEMGNRFFFEEPGHVRRLTTEQVRVLFAERGFTLTRHYYSNQYFGAIDWITRAGPRFVWRLTDSTAATNRASRRFLRRLRAYLLPISVLRFLTHGVETRLHSGNRTFRNYLFLIGMLGAYVVVKPFGLLVESALKRRARHEWLTRKTEENGSEMYLVFSR